MRAVGSATAVLSLALLGLCACGSSPGGFGARFTENGALLLDGPAARMTPAAAAAERAKAVTLLYQFAIDAGQVPPAPGVAAVPDADTLAAQEIALTRVANWKKVTLAGEAYIDKQCQDFLAALDVLEKSRRTTLANLNSLQSATTGIMGLVHRAGDDGYHRHRLRARQQPVRPDHLDRALPASGVVRHRDRRGAAPVAAQPGNGGARDARMAGHRRPAQRLGASLCLYSILRAADDRGDDHQGAEQDRNQREGRHRRHPYPAGGHRRIARPDS